MVICKSKQNKFEGDLKIKLHSKRHPTESFKYLVVKVDVKLISQYHVSDLSIKLNRANVLLFKIRKYVSLKILGSCIFLFLTLIYPTTVLSRFRILALFNKF